jgi:hypothetical protein
MSIYLQKEINEKAEKKRKATKTKYNVTSITYEYVVVINNS